MATDTGKLTVAAVKSAAPGKHFDGGGLFLHVMPNGAKYWRMKYRFGGKEKLLAIGVFPSVTIAEARRRRDTARIDLRDGTDPGALKQQRKADTEAATDSTFESIARTWMQRQHVAEITANKNRWLLESFLFPHIGSRPIASITPKELLTVLRKVEASGKLETAARAEQGRTSVSLRHP